jgi:hypothetical protein
MTEQTDVVVVGGVAAAAGAERAATAGGARVVAVASVTRLLRPGDALRGVALRTAAGDDAVVEAVAVILADGGADTLAAALAVGAQPHADGLLTDEHARVLDAAQLPIPGLYAAAGEDAGQRAGTHAAARVAARPSR